jgi:hypothetical protein
MVHMTRTNQMTETRQYELRTKQRTHTLLVVELADRIDVTLSSTRYRICGDEAEFMRWLTPILERYQPDSRPLVMLGHGGERYTVHDSFTLIDQGPDPN